MDAATRRASAADSRITRHASRPQNASRSRPGARGCRRRCHAGYVLPLTLLLLAVAAASLAGVCRASFEAAVAAAHARDDLQRRWAVTSCRRALLPKAERVLAAVDSASDGLSEARLDLRLGGMPIELVFGDEQAKVKVDVLYNDGGRAGTEVALRELALAGAAADVRVALRPGHERPVSDSDEPNKVEQEDEVERFTSWSQVFGDTPAAALVRRGAGGRSAVAEVTCWGDGTLNFRRASAAAIGRACPKSLGGTGAARLVRIRQDDPEVDLTDALEQLELTDDQLAQVEERLTDESSCYSLWIVARAAGRAWYDLSIADDSAGDGDAGAVVAFSW